MMYLQSVGVVYRISGLKSLKIFNFQVSSPLPCRDDLNKELIFDFKDIISISGKIEKPSIRDVKGEKQLLRCS